MAVIFTKIAGFEQVSNASSITVNDLTVVDFYNVNRLNADEHLRWQQRKLAKSIAYAEKCDRNIWYGAAGSFADFPQLNADESNRYLQGPEAYAHLLRFMLGHVNPSGYDPKAGERFFDGWSKLNRMNPQGAGAFEELIWHLSADYARIKNNVCGRIKPDRQWLVARDLSGLQKHESVLIVGHIDSKEGKASVLTQKIAMTMNGGGAYKLRDIGITHPNHDIAEALHRQITQLYKSKNIPTGNVSIYHFYDHMALAMEWSERVFVTLDMDAHPGADQFMIDCWRNRQHRNNTLTHMKAPPANLGLSSPLWAQAGLDNYVSPEDIRDQIQANKDDYLRMLGRTHHAALYCGQLRAQRIQPSTALLREIPALLAPPEQQLSLL